jgi:hypothetical protein
MDLLALQGVTANEFAEIVGLVRGGTPVRAHFVQADGNARLRCLPRSFAARKTASNDMNRFQSFSVRLQAGQ